MELYRIGFFIQHAFVRCIAARPMLLCHVQDAKNLPKWSGAKNPWVLKIKDEIWHLTNPDTNETEEIDPIAIMNKKLFEGTT